MEIILEFILKFILEIIFARFVFRFLGLNTRYFLLKIFNNSLQKTDLIGDDEDFGSLFANDLLNAVVGFIVLFLIFYMASSIFYG